MAVVRNIISLLMCSVVVLGQERLLSSEDLLSSVVQDCSVGETSVTTCMRQRVLSFINNNMGVTDERNGRQLNDESLDEQIAARAMKFVNSHDFQVQLPEFLFQSAVLTFRPARGLADFKVDFPMQEQEARANSEARDMLKKKLLLPILLLLKLKLKAITPILLLLVGMKAFKALIMSKISLLLVVGFLVTQLFKKLGMPMPMPMPMMPAAYATDIPPVYGPAPTPAPYGPPASTPDNSYGPWDPSANGPSSYARWDAQNMAYNSYQPETKAPKSS